MKHLTILFLTAIVLYACQPSGDDKQKITDLLHQQQDAWNNGDIKEFMKAYWVSDSLKFIGAGGITYGYHNTFENYQRRYPNKATMGTLTFGILHLTRISDDAYQMVGKWDLSRSMGDIGGIFTLLWRRIDGQWLIVSDHTSVRPGE